MDVRVKVKVENRENGKDKEKDEKVKAKEINLFVQNEWELGSDVIKGENVVVVVDFDDFGEYMRYYFDVKNEIDLEMNQGLKDEM
jgi:hypothetical protein